MTDKAAIQGNYADLKYIKTRSVVQVVVEVPIEQAHMITDAFGWPQPGKEIPVAVARLKPGPVEPKEKRKFEDLPPSQQAGIRCNDPGFQEWCMERLAETDFQFSDTDNAVELAAAHVRMQCAVGSRSQLNGPIASKRWEALNEKYLTNTHMAEQR
jgi:hypothetical protein